MEYGQSIFETFQLADTGVKNDDVYRKMIPPTLPLIENFNFTANSGGVLEPLINYALSEFYIYAVHLPPCPPNDKGWDLGIGLAVAI